ncbi:hypothetical protein K438DRAFT_1992581 [Mycena galopus ATCC 62051]|nr:hypothetical protein K438DRAFT_1992581 [Mycena galopus ATCC 62051]
MAANRGASPVIPTSSLPSDTIPTPSTHNGSGTSPPSLYRYPAFAMIVTRTHIPIAPSSSLSSHSPSASTILIAPHHPQHPPTGILARAMPCMLISTISGTLIFVASASAATFSNTEVKVCPPSRRLCALISVEARLDGSTRLVPVASTRAELRPAYLRDDARDLPSLGGPTCLAIVILARRAILSY